MQARIVRFHQPGAPGVMQLETAEVGAPGAGEALIRNTVIGLNFADIYQRSGFYPLPLPSGVGTEAAAVVEQVGPGVTSCKPGDRVAYAGGPIGAYADLRLIPADRLVPIPAGITDEQAAASLLKGMTVEYLLNRAYSLQAGQTTLFYAAAGGVGLIAGQWGRSLGATMIGVVSGAEKAKLALANGYAHVIDRTREKIVDRVREITGGKMLPVLFDSVGQATYEDSLHCLAPRGMFVSFGAASGACPAVDPGLLQKLGSLYFTRPTLATYCNARADLLASAAALFDRMAQGVVKVQVTERYRLTDVVSAHNDLQSGRTVGSSVIVP